MKKTYFIVKTEEIFFSFFQGQIIFEMRVQNAWFFILLAKLELSGSHNLSHMPFPKVRGIQSTLRAFKPCLGQNYNIKFGKILVVSASKVFFHSLTYFGTAGIFFQSVRLNCKTFVRENQVCRIFNPRNAWRLHQDKTHHNYAYKKKGTFLHTILTQICLIIKG